MATENTSAPVIDSAPVIAPVEPKAEFVSTTKVQRIQTCNPVVPTTGSNAGQQMFVINGKEWSKTEPKPTDTHVVLVSVEIKGKVYWNVQGYSQETRVMSIDAKIKAITEHDAAYSMAIASLLR